MLAVSCVSQSTDDPLSGLEVGQVADPEVPDGWVRVHVKAASLNHHDLWSLRGVGLSADALPMIPPPVSIARRLIDAWVNEVIS